MPLLNYTTDVPADKTINEIHKCLAAHGARAILNEYDDNGYITAVSFKITASDQQIAFRLPSDWRPVLKILETDPKVTRRFKPTQEQALKVAWRIIKDWVEAQMAIVETRMVTLEQVFLPYIVMDDGQTLYDRMKKSNFLLPPGNNIAA